MRRRALIAAALGLAVVLVDLGPASRRARADNNIPDLTMFPDYFGAFTSSATGVGSVEFEITRQEGRHFWGVVTFEFGGLGTAGFEFHGTVAATNEFKGKGSGPAGEVVFDGMLDPIPAGDKVFIIMADYMFMSADGRMDEGTVFATNAPIGGR